MPSVPALRRRRERRKYPPNAMVGTVTNITPTISRAASLMCILLGISYSPIRDY
jgi:hypothetical protein